MADFSLADLKLAPGFFSDQTGRGAVGRYKGGNHARFRDKLPEKIGGFVDVNDVIVAGKARALHDWVSLDNKKWVAIGTSTKLYLYGQSQLYDITPIQSTGTLTDPFTTMIGSNLVTVTHTAHGRQVGDTVYFSGASPVGGITINGEYLVVSKTVNDYVIMHSLPATSSAGPGGGTVSYQYELSTSQAVSSGFGWGRGGWGSGGWSTPGAVTEDTSDRISPLRIWSLDNFGEDLLASPRAGALYWWDRSAGPTTRATLVATAPKFNNRMTVDHDARIVILYGSSTDADVQDPLLVRWSDTEDFTNFAPDPANSAGDDRLGNGSRAITAVKSRAGEVVFTDESLYYQQYVGSDDIYDFTPIGSSVSVVGPEAVVDVDGVVYFMGVNNFYIYDGLLRVLDCDVWPDVFKQLNTAHREKVVASVNRMFGEVWWCYPAGVSEEPNMYVIYNYVDRIWYFGTVDRTAIHDYSSAFGVPYGVTSSGRLLKHETGYNDVAADGTALELASYIESYDIELSPGEQLMQLNELIPDFVTLIGVSEITLKTRQYPHRPQRLKGPYTFDGDEVHIHVRARGRQVAIEFSQEGLNTQWRMGTWRAAVRPHGRR